MVFIKRRKPPPGLENLCTPVSPMMRFCSGINPDEINLRPRGFEPRLAACPAAMPTNRANARSHIKHLKIQVCFGVLKAFRATVRLFFCKLWDSNFLQYLTLDADECLFSRTFVLTTC
jgi:hypothetical protein